MPAATAVTRVSSLGVVNAFLVAEEDGLTLVDTTIAGGAKAIMSAASEIGLPIVRIALTHAHGDHVGQLDALAERLPGIEISISERDAPMLEKDKTPRPGEPGDAKYRGSYPGTGTRPTRLLSAGDRVGSLEVVPSPGHTPGHVSFLDTRDRTLIAGDAYSTLGGMTTSASLNPRFPLPYLATWHRPTALRSARELRVLDPARLAVGHGPTVDRPGAAMDRAIARAG